MLDSTTKGREVDSSFRQQATNLSAELRFIPILFTPIFIPIFRYLKI